MNASRIRSSVHASSGMLGSEVVIVVPADVGDLSGGLRQPEGHVALSLDELLGGEPAALPDAVLLALGPALLVGALLGLRHAAVDLRLEAHRVDGEVLDPGN